MLRVFVFSVRRLWGFKEIQNASKSVLLLSGMILTIGDV